MSTLLVFRCSSSSHQAISTITKRFSPRNGGKNFLLLRFQSLQVYNTLKNTWAGISKMIEIISYCHTGRNVG